MHSWESCRGIEGLKSLVEGATTLLERFNDAVFPTLPSKERANRETMEVAFVHDDFFADDSWLSGTVVYCDLTCFNPELTQRFVDLCAELSHGAAVITLTKHLTEDYRAPHLFLLWSEPAETNWGTTTLYVYERKPDQEALEKLLKKGAGKISSNL